MHQNKRQRLWHTFDPRRRFLARLSHLGITLALATSFAPAQTPAPPEPAPLQIRILNAQTSKPVPNERLNVSFREQQIGFRLLPTDRRGIIELHPGSAATTLHLLTNFYADCRPRAELYTNYPLATLRSSGITGGNLCSSAHPAPKPGELTLFVIPKNAIPTMGQPPATGLPHSDENPNATTNNPFPAPH